MKKNIVEILDIKLKVCLIILLTISSIGAQINAQNYEILYTKQVNNNDNIHVINQNGRSKQITDNRRKDSSPMLSPNGNYIVFASERVGWWKIWLLDIKKNKYKQLTNSSSAEYSPSWSPDGRQIVFVSSRDGHNNIYIMDADGRNINTLTDNKKSNVMPFWANDNFIYYSSKVGVTYQIMRMLPNGSKKEQITTGRGDKLMPQLTNDCKTILYYGNANGNNEIYILSLKNSTITRLTNNSLMSIRARWSSDDKKIVFERGNKKDNQNIYMMDASGENAKQLTFKNYNYAPSFVTNNIKLLEN